METSILYRKYQHGLFVRIETSRTGALTYDVVLGELISRRLQDTLLHVIYMRDAGSKLAKWAFERIVKNRIIKKLKNRY